MAHLPVVGGVISKPLVLGGYPDISNESAKVRGAAPQKGINHKTS
jgi:hypothetical protein